jgi:hypothetical protein
MDAPQMPETSRFPETKAEREAVRDQLHRILLNPLFKNSKRCSFLLRYVVEQTLEARTGEMKERALGIKVFGRDPDYDTNADPIVRAAACDIRKRIAQYYHEAGHEAEIRIDLQPGSYVPEFRLLKKPAEAPAEPVAVEPPHPARSWLRYALAGAVAVLALGLVIARGWNSRSVLDRFWGPVLDSPGSVLICAGQRQFLGSAPESPQQPSPDIERWVRPGEFATPVTLFKLYYMGGQNLSLAEAITIGRLTGLLDARKKTYSVRGESSTTFSDLRSGSVVLIGAFNNDWTMRVMGPLRFNFLREGTTFWIEDRKNPTLRSRSVNYEMPYLHLTEDFAVVSRVLDPTTERMVVLAGGLTGYGTMAAGELLGNPEYTKLILEGAPANWERKNLQVVISTKVIHGSSGPPRVVDRYFW